MSKYFLALPLAATLALAGCGGPSPQQEFTKDVAAFTSQNVAIHNADLEPKAPYSASIQFMSKSQPGHIEDGADMGNFLRALYGDKKLPLGDSYIIYDVPVKGMPLQIFTFTVHGATYRQELKDKTLANVPIAEDKAFDITSTNLLNALAAGFGTKSP